MFCTHCGTEAHADDRFCRSCGRELGTSETGAASTAPTERPATPPGGQPGPIWSGQPLQASRTGAPHTAAGNAPESRMLGAAQLAATGQRIGAFLIDIVLGAIGFIVAAAIVYIFYLIATGTTPSDELSDADAETLGGWVWGVWAIFFFLTTWVLNATGGSLGKRIVGLRIVRDDLRSPGVGVGLGRTLAAWLSWVPVGLGFLWGTWDARGQTWHDKMASTYVVRADSLPRPEPQAADADVGGGAGFGPR